MDSRVDITAPASPLTPAKAHALDLDPVEAHCRPGHQARLVRQHEDADVGPDATDDPSEQTSEGRVSRPLAGGHPIRGVVQLGHNLVFAELSTEPAQHSVEALGQGAGLAAHRDGKRRRQVTGFQPAHRLAEPPESLGLTAGHPHAGKDGERRDQERPASDQKRLVPALARDLGRRDTHHQRPAARMDPDGPGDSRLTVLEHRLAGAASREELSRTQRGWRRSP